MVPITESWATDKETAKLKNKRNKVSKQVPEMSEWSHRPKERITKKREREIEKPDVTRADEKQRVIVLATVSESHSLPWNDTHLIINLSLLKPPHSL